MKALRHWRNGGRPDHLVLRYYQGQADREIADELGCAVGTVRSIASRAFAQLRQHPGLAELAPRTGLGREA